MRKWNNTHSIDHFLKSTKAVTTGKEVRAVRKAYDDAVAHGLEAHEKHKQVAQLHSQINAAISQAGAEELTTLQYDLTKYQSELRAASKELKTATAREHELAASLAEQEASFTQKELTEIVLERRCARSPLRLANAMAGLPLLSARVSYERCSKLKCAAWPHFQFVVVKFIESTWKRRHRYPGLSIVELFDQEIKRLPRTIRREKPPEANVVPREKKRVDNYLRLYLGEHRRYLRLAIERSLGAPNIEENQTPFVIASSFSAVLGEPGPT